MREGSDPDTELSQAQRVWITRLQDDALRESSHHRSLSDREDLCSSTFQERWVSRIIYYVITGILFFSVMYLETAVSLDDVEPMWLIWTAFVTSNILYFASQLLPAGSLGHELPLPINASLLNQSTAFKSTLPPPISLVRSFPLPRNVLSQTFRSASDIELQLPYEGTSSLIESTPLSLIHTLYYLECIESSLASRASTAADSLLISSSASASNPSSVSSSSTSSTPPLSNSVGQISIVDGRSRLSTSQPPSVPGSSPSPNFPSPSATSSQITFTTPTLSPFHLQLIARVIASPRFCPQCSIVRPSGARHCFKCGHCVPRFDHRMLSLPYQPRFTGLLVCYLVGYLCLVVVFRKRLCSPILTSLAFGVAFSLFLLYYSDCPFMGNCVGARNHPIFLSFLSVQALVLLLAIWVNYDAAQAYHYFYGSPGTLFFLHISFAALAVVVCLLVIPLCLMHHWLMLSGLTTYSLSIQARKARAQRNQMTKQRAKATLQSEGMEHGDEDELDDDKHADTADLDVCDGDCIELQRRYKEWKASRDTSPTTSISSSPIDLAKRRDHQGQESRSPLPSSSPSTGSSCASINGTSFNDGDETVSESDIETGVSTTLLPVTTRPSGASSVSPYSSSAKPQSKPSLVEVYSQVKLEAGHSTLPQSNACQTCHLGSCSGSSTHASPSPSPLSPLPSVPSSTATSRSTPEGSTSSSGMSGNNRPSWQVALVMDPALRSFRKGPNNDDDDNDESSGSGGEGEGEGDLSGGSKRDNNALSRDPTPNAMRVSSTNVTSIYDKARPVHSFIERDSNGQFSSESKLTILSVSNPTTESACSTSSAAVNTRSQPQTTNQATVEYVAVSILPSDSLTHPRTSTSHSIFVSSSVPSQSSSSPSLHHLDLVDPPLLWLHSEPVGSLLAQTLPPSFNVLASHIVADSVSDDVHAQTLSLLQLDVLRVAGVSLPALPDPTSPTSSLHLPLANPQSVDPSRSQIWSIGSMITTTVISILSALTRSYTYTRAWLELKHIAHRLFHFWTVYTFLPTVTRPLYRLPTCTSAGFTFVRPPIHSPNAHPCFSSAVLTSDPLSTAIDSALDPTASHSFSVAAKDNVDSFIKSLQTKWRSKFQQKQA